MDQTPVERTAGPLRINNEVSIRYGVKKHKELSYNRCVGHSHGNRILSTRKIQVTAGLTSAEEAHAGLPIAAPRDIQATVIRNNSEDGIFINYNTSRI
jgi:hypothetical protein